MYGGCRAKFGHNTAAVRWIKLQKAGDWRTQAIPHASAFRFPHAARSPFLPLGEPGRHCASYRLYHHSYGTGVIVRPS